MVMAIEQDIGQNDNPAMPDVDYEELLDDYSHFAPPAEGEVLQGRVLKVTAKDVIIDFGYKSEGLVPIEQFTTPSGEVTVKAGAVFSRQFAADRGMRSESVNQQSSEA